MLVYVLIIKLGVLREIDLSGLVAVSEEALILVGAVLIILGAALGFTSFLVDIQLPMLLLDKMVLVVHQRWLFLLLLNLFLLVVGSLMDIFSAVVVVVPLLLPLAEHYGVDPLHLGVIFLLNLEIGYCTPPVGLNLFIAGHRFHKPVLEVYRATWPFLLVMLAALLLVTYFPWLIPGI